MFLNLFTIPPWIKFFAFFPLVPEPTRGISKLSGCLGPLGHQGAPNQIGKYIFLDDLNEWHDELIHLNE